jgi:predicted metal-binding membrane protein
MMSETTAVEAVLKRDRAVVLATIAGPSALAWAYLLALAWQMPHEDMAMPHMHAWGAAEVVLTWVMWAVMMVAMMTPSAAPMILTFAAINRRRQAQQGPLVPTAVFVLGYLLVWGGFSVVATLVQWGLHTAALLSPMVVVTSPVVGGLLLIAAGIFQWTPLKSTCLTQCRSPLGFIMTEWREGTWGALVMGLRHGSYCVGCCWVLMALLFVAGVMNLIWVTVIAVLILVEKVLPRGELVGGPRGGGRVHAGGPAPARSAAAHVAGLLQIPERVRDLCRMAVGQVVGDACHIPAREVHASGLSGGHALEPAEPRRKRRRLPSVHGALCRPFLSGVGGMTRNPVPGRKEFHHGGRSSMVDEGRLVRRVKLQYPLPVRVRTATNQQSLRRFARLPHPRGCIRYHPA